MADVEHLKMIQAVITRMAGNSFLLKGWAVTLVSGLAALAKIDANDDVAWISCGVVVIFALMDGYYLALERAYRRLYNRAVHDEVEPYSLKPDGLGFQDVAAAVLSVSIWPLYGAALAGAVLVAANVV